MNKFTRGPWVVKKFDRNEGERVSFGLVGCGCNVYGMPEGEANARLIAAALDLLKALQRIADTDYALGTPKIRATARAAIAKANER